MVLSEEKVEHNKTIRFYQYRMINDDQGHAEYHYYIKRPQQFEQNIENAECQKRANYSEALDV